MCFGGGCEIYLAGLFAWRMDEGLEAALNSVEALKPLVKLGLIISYGDEYRIDHGQKTVQPGAPAGEERRDEEGYTQCKQLSLLLSS